ncbi:MAG: restriction endonuclease subunit S [Gallionella sp.]|nr:restriction endonuclease subunit S [Gallionella sp.]
MSEWQESALGDFINVKHGYAFKGDEITSEERAEVLVTPGNFYIGGGFKSGKFKFFKGNFPQSYVLKENDIVVTMTDLSKEGDTLGYGAKIPKSNGKVFLHNQRIGLVEFIRGDICKDFLYWILRTAGYQGFVLGAATGTSIRHTSPTTIKEYKFLRPTLNEQKTIAAVLSSLDDKIDLLHRQNKTLEAMAETLFRQWFVEEVQVDWEEGKVEDLFVLQRGYDLPAQNRTDGPYPIYAASGYSGGHSECKVKGPGVTTGRSGLLGKVFFVLEDFWPLNTSLYVKEFKRGTPLFSYFFLKTLDLNSYNAGSAVPTLNRNHVHSEKASLPPVDLIKRFEEIAHPLYQKIKQNESQVRGLETLRDTLLPKLMSGEVRVV